MCLGNESNTIAKFFDTGFTCDETLQTYVDNLLISASITLFCVFFCPYLSHSMSLKYLQGLHPPICDFQIRYIYQKSHLHLGRKTLDIVSSSIISIYDVNKMQNSILKIPLFHTPAPHFSRNGHDTMGDISKQKLDMTDSFCIYGGIFLPISYLKY